MDLYEELTGLIDSLRKAGLDYALCGGIAVAFYGYPRFTKDIDILIRSEDLEQILEAITERGFSIKGGLMPFDWGKPSQREIYRVSKVEDKELLTLDLILVNKISRMFGTNAKRLHGKINRYRWFHPKA